MFDKATLKKYARLVLEIGVNLQRNQGLELACPVETAYLAEIFTEEAYKLGAKIVRVRWSDEKTDRLNYLYADTTALTDIPKWFVDSKNYLVEKGFCYVVIDCEDPFAFKDIPAEKLSAVAKARSKALKKFSDEVMSNGLRWCIASIPSKAWAEKVFPNTPDAEQKLFELIALTTRLTSDDPVKAWREHVSRLNARAEFLNAKNFEYLIFTNGYGTALKVGLATDHIWISAKERAKDGLEFVANMPTEEVFTAPHKDKVDGKLVSALPLSYNGQIIDGFSITFKGGKIVDFSAEKGYEALKELINTDKGTRYLGEVALIGKNSPVANCKTLFYNTLFDENASCHLAIGKGYPTTVKNGEKLSIAELKAKGVNESIEHVDFMIGTPDLKVVGVEYDGNETLIFDDGEWVI